MRCRRCVARPRRGPSRYTGGRPSARTSRTTPGLIRFARLWRRCLPSRTCGSPSGRSRPRTPPGSGGTSRGPAGPGETTASLSSFRRSSASFHSWRPRFGTRTAPTASPATTETSPVSWRWAGTRSAPRRTSNAGGKGSATKTRATAPACPASCRAAAPTARVPTRGAPTLWGTGATAASASLTPKLSPSFDTRPPTRGRVSSLPCPESESPPP
mmetsp:Transcript_52211/g.119092  ORF Transcript_52211/g.119092 Transcript_52211/m.119092 type:complete len:214 (-) Transcript_52211:232-873(-)